MNFAREWRASHRRSASASSCGNLTDEFVKCQILHALRDGDIDRGARFAVEAVRKMLDCPLFTCRSLVEQLLSRGADSLAVVLGDRTAQSLVEDLAFCSKSVAFLEWHVYILYHFDLASGH